jgi:hypothetical protein
MRSGPGQVLRLEIEEERRGYKGLERVGIYGDIDHQRELLQAVFHEDQSLAQILQHYVPGSVPEADHYADPGP